MSFGTGNRKERKETLTSSGELELDGIRLQPHAMVDSVPDDGRDRATGRVSLAVRIYEEPLKHPSHFGPLGRG